MQDYVKIWLKVASIVTCGGASNTFLRLVPVTGAAVNFARRNFSFFERQMFSDREK
jgi:hypothetical protein